MSETPLTYKTAGVDVEAGYESVSRMKQHIKKTLNSQVMEGLGNFGGLYALNQKNIKEPILVSGTDGVGTKLKLAFDLDKHDTIGIDCVAMCVNDVLCHGAKSLFFLDYLATGHLEPEKAETIVKGITDGCKLSRAALIGGETAEMPGFYPSGEYDLAGFVVGMVDKEKLIDGSSIELGDQIIGLASTGVHSNGFSLVRKILEVKNIDIKKVYEPFDEAIGKVLLEPTKIYCDAVEPLIEKYDVKGIAHITGGGFYENIPRILPKHLNAQIDLNSHELPDIFKWLQNQGNLEIDDMYHTFNMGIGMALVVPKEQAESVLKDLKNEGHEAYAMGEITNGTGAIELCQR